MNPTAAHGMPMNTATIPLPSCPDATVSGMFATRSSAATPPVTAAHVPAALEPAVRLSLTRPGYGVSVPGTLPLA
jgi:hypothetical protein